MTFGQKLTKSNGLCAKNLLIAISKVHNEPSSSKEVYCHINQNNLKVSTAECLAFCSINEGSCA